MIEPDEMIELFISGIFLLIAASILVQLYWDIDISGLINVVIEIGVPVFVALFLASIFANLISEIMS